MKNKKLIITISIDDVNPLKDFRILGTKTEKWLEQLYIDFGIKYNLFIPSNYHGKNKLSENKSWIQEINDKPYFSCEAHGHFHMTSDTQQFGECEFFEIKTIDVALERVKMIYEEWNECGLGFEKLGWRNPGWLCSEGSCHVLQRNFSYAAIHYEHNQGLNWNCKTFFGHDGIQQQTVAVHNDDMIMFQSHIAGKHNHNVWNEQNYDQLRLSLDHLFQNYQIEPKFLNECL